MNRISEFRKKAELNQLDFARLLGVTQSAVSHYEVGCRLPRIHICKKIVSCLRGLGLDVSLDDVFPDRDTDEA